jgi:hypothetical protein
MKLAAPALTIAALAIACRGSPPTGSADRGELCADVGTRRACWGPECSNGVCLVERTLPNGPRPKGGWRCAGSAAGRRCTPRARGSGAFACDASGTCTQRRPRYPDDGEWECTDRAGVVICRGGVDAAGIVPGPPDRGWLCGHGSSSLWGNRVCVDLSPDLPDEQRGWSCRYELAGDEHRVCTPSTTAQVGGACRAHRDCPTGSACVAGACLPPRPSPGCFVDADCGSNQCLFGTCGADTH